jgi:hypothetical protein
MTEIPVTCTTCLLLDYFISFGAYIVPHRTEISVKLPHSFNTIYSSMIDLLSLS